MVLILGFVLWDNILVRQLSKLGGDCGKLREMAHEARKLMPSGDTLDIGIARSTIQPAGSCSRKR